VIQRGGVTSVHTTPSIKVPLAPTVRWPMQVVQWSVINISFIIVFVKLTLLAIMLLKRMTPTRR